MKPRIIKLKRYSYSKPKICPFCLLNQSIGWTIYGILGCRFCQSEVDKIIARDFAVIEARR